MCLPIPEVDHFYALWRPLLFFVNRQRQLVPSLLDAPLDSNLSVQDALKIRQELWQDDGLIDAFIAKNPANLSDKDLSTMASWKQRTAGTFFVFKYLKKHTLFIENGKRKVYAVKGLYSPFEELFGPYPPILTKAVLLPWENEIITDGLFQHYNVSFGSGIRSDLKSIYDDAKEMGAIVTTLIPSESAATPEAEAAKAEATNARVMPAFQKHLYQSGQSPKIVERDMATIAALAATGLRQAERPGSLREINPTVLTQYLSALPGSEKKQAATGIKRFVKFLRDTVRLDYDAAEEMLFSLKGGE